MIATERERASECERVSASLQVGMRNILPSLNKYDVWLLLRGNKTRRLLSASVLTFMPRAADGDQSFKNARTHTNLITGRQNWSCENWRKGTQIV